MFDDWDGDRVWLIGFYVVATLFAVELVVKYGLVPLVGRKRASKPMDPGFVAFSLDELDPAFGTLFLGPAGDLAGLGFTALGHVAQHLGDAQPTGRVSLWVNRANGDVAQVIAVVVPGKKGKPGKLTSHVMFVQEYADGGAVATTDAKAPSVSTPDPGQNVVATPGVWELGRLYAFHNARTARYRNGRAVRLPREGKAVAYMTEEWRRTFKSWTDAGLYTVDEATRTYRQTLKGAYLMTWRLLPPLKSLRQYKRLRAANADLKACGFGSLAKFRAGLSAERPRVALADVVGA